MQVTFILGRFNKAVLEYNRQQPSFNRTIIHVYAAITDAEEEKVDELYGQVQFEIDGTRS